MENEKKKKHMEIMKLKLSNGCIGNADEKKKKNGDKVNTFRWQKNASQFYLQISTLSRDRQLSFFIFFRGTLLVT